MTEYDYSPAAWEAHLAKQARIAEWSAKAAPSKCANPFKPTEEEIARLKASGFYNPDGTPKPMVYPGPDRPPSPGLSPRGSSPHCASGTTTPVSPATYPANAQQPIVVPPGYTAHVSVYNPATGRYEWQKFGGSSKSKGGRSKPTRSATMPAVMYPAQQAAPQYPYPYPKQQPYSGSTVASQTSGSLGYVQAHPGAAVIVNGATPKKPKKLHKAREA